MSSNGEMQQMCTSHGSKTPSPQRQHRSDSSNNTHQVKGAVAHAQSGWCHNGATSGARYRRRQRHQPLLTDADPHNYWVLVMEINLEAASLWDTIEDDTVSRKEDKQELAALIRSTTCSLGR